MSDQGQKTRLNAAATGFALMLAAAAGWAGVLVAALAVGCERAWNGRGEGPQARAARSQSRLAGHRAWLAQDAERQQQWRQARRDWWAAGADPATQPKASPLAARAGAWTRRRWARTRVTLAAFTSGFAEGWRTADVDRRAKAPWRQIATARPRPDEHALPDEPDTIVDGEDLPPWTSPHPTAEERERLIPNNGEKYTCPRCGSAVLAGIVFSKRRCDECSARIGLCRSRRHVIARNEDLTWPRCCEQTADPKASTATQTPTTVGPQGPHVEGAPMTAPTTTAPQAGAQTESNAAVMADHLGQLKQHADRITALNDELASAQAAMAQATRQATEFAESTGQTDQTRQALDASTAVVSQVGQYVGGVADAAVEAEDQVGAARDGLQPVLHAEDALTSAGADGRAVAPATAA